MSGGRAAHAAVSCRSARLQVLIANRDKIVWCTKLMRAKSEEETAGLEREMYNTPALTDILGALKATRASARDRKNAIIEEVKEEARRLRTHDADGAAAGGADVVDRDVAARQVLDLEALQFDGGGRHLAKKSVKLPAETFKRNGKGYEEARPPFCTDVPSLLTHVAHGRVSNIARATAGWAQQQANCHCKCRFASRRRSRKARATSWCRSRPYQTGRSLHSPA